MKKGLGKGLESIFGDNYTEKVVKNEGVSRIKLSQIEAKSDQPRKYFDTDSLETLADSIAQHGVIQPIIVRKTLTGFYQIIAGERRFRASKMAGLSEIPCIVIQADELKTAQLSLIENIQREDLNPYEEAQAYASLMKDFDLTQEEVSAQVGKSRSAISNTMRLLDLPDEVLELLKTGDISAGHARALLGLSDKSAIVDTAHKILIRSLSVRDTEALVKKLNKLFEAAEQGEDDENGAVVVDYVKDLEKKARDLMGRQVKIKANGKNKSIQIEFVDNEDLEVLLVKLCGKKITEEIL